MNNKIYLLLPSSFSFFLLVFAYYSEYFMGLHPCNLCMWQRYAHFIILFGVVIYFFKLQKVFIFVSVSGILSSVLISTYHYGVEKGFFKALGSCSATLGQNLSVEELYSKIMSTKVVKCSDVQWEFISISMAGWNALVSLFMLIIFIYFIKLNFDNKAL